MSSTVFPADSDEVPRIEVVESEVQYPVSVTRRNTLARPSRFSVQDQEAQLEFLGPTSLDPATFDSSHNRLTSPRRSTLDVSAFMVERSKRPSKVFLDTPMAPAFYVNKTPARSYLYGLWLQLTFRSPYNACDVRCTPLHGAYIVPPPFIALCYVVVIVTGVFVFIVNSPQRNGVSGTDFALPTVLLVVIFWLTSFANALGTHLLTYCNNYIVEERVYPVVSTHKVILYGLTSENNMTLPAATVMRASQDNASFVDADLLLNVINDIAVAKSAPPKWLHVLGHIVVVVLAATLALSPSLPRMIHTGTMWGTGTAVQVIFAVMCAVVSFLCSLGIFSIYLMQIHTMRFILARVHATEVLFNGGRWGGLHWPMMHVESNEALTSWIRLRWALHRPTFDVYRVGNRAMEAMSIVALMSYIYAAVVNALSSVNVGNTSGRSNVLEGSFAVALFFAVINGLYTTIILSLQERANTFLRNNTIDVHNRTIGERREEVREVVGQATLIVERSTKYLKFMRIRVRWITVIISVIVSAIIIVLAVLRAALLLP